MPVKPWARIAIKDMARRCVVDRKALWTIAELWLLRKYALLPEDAGSKALMQRLEKNSPFARIAAPLLIVQGERDESVLSNVQRAYVRGRCKVGQHLSYIEYPAVDHMGLVAAGSPLTPDLLAWTSTKLATSSLGRAEVHMHAPPLASQATMLAC